MSSKVTSSLALHRRRKRASAACDTCHARKVRCDISLAGPPCTNCAHDETECKLYERPNKRQKFYAALTAPIPEASTESVLGSVLPKDANGSLEANQPMVHLSPTSLGSSGRAWSPPCEQMTDSIRPQADEQIVTGADVSAAQEDFGEQSTPTSNGDNLTAFHIAIEGHADKNAMPFYVGDEHGLRFFLDICKPDRAVKGLHHPVPPVTAKSQSEGYSVYLNLSTAYSLLSKEIGEELIRCFFHYVHPVTPIVDATTFLREYTEEGRPKTSSLLLWSVYFVGASYIGKQELAAAGYESRRALQVSCYKMAKHLYDIDAESDKIALMQSVILLSHWYEDTEDRNGAWHWNGVAISLCHTIGLHRNMETMYPQRQPFPSTQRSLWRLIWWACFYREVWLALGYGRPMRINLDDCDTPLPSPDDFLAHTTENDPIKRERYLPPHHYPLSNCYISLLNITITLSRLLSTHYRPRKQPLLADVIETDETEILELQERYKSTSNIDDGVLGVHDCHFRLLSGAVMIVLYRPYLLNPPDGIPDSARASWLVNARHKVNAAASQASAVLNQLTMMDWVRFCLPTVLTAMRPAMQIYFWSSASANSLERRRASTQLDLFMLVLEEMQDVYWTAGLHHDLFNKARERLRRSTAHQASTTDAPSGAARIFARAESQANLQAPVSDTAAEFGISPSNGDQLSEALFRNQPLWQEPRSGLPSPMHESNAGLIHADSGDMPWDLDVEAIWTSNDSNIMGSLADYLPM